MNKTIIINGRIVLPEGVLADGCVEFADGKITAVKEGPYNGQATRYDYQCAGQLCFAGLYRHPYPRSPAVTILWTVRSKRIWGLRRCMPGTGRRRCCPTTLTSTNEELLNTFATYKEAKAQNRSGAAFLGLHLEGPYFSYNQRGAQDPKYLRNPRPEEYETILAASDDIVRWSVAPELDGALEFGRRLAERVSCLRSGIPMRFTNRSKRLIGMPVIRMSRISIRVCPPLRAAMPTVMRERWRRPI